MQDCSILGAFAVEIRQSYAKPSVLLLQNFVKIGSGNGLLFDGCKPFPEPILACRNEIMWHSLEGNFLQNAQNINQYNFIFSITAPSPAESIKVKMKVFGYS